MRTTQTLTNIIVMRTDQENIELFLDIVGDENPVHRDIASANDLVRRANELTKETKREVKDKTIIPGLYIASQITRKYPDCKHFEFEFKDFMYTGEDVDLVKELNEYKRPICKQNGDLKLEAVIEKDPLEPLAINNGFEYQCHISEYLIRNFNKCLKNNIDTNGKIPRYLPGSLISGALWHYLKSKMKDGYGLYRKQTWNFHRDAEVGKGVVTKVILEKERRNMYFFGTSVEAEDNYGNLNIVVSGKAVCIFLPK